MSELISLVAAAKLLGCSEQTVLRWVREGTLPGVERGGVVWFDPDELVACQKKMDTVRQTAVPDATRGDTNVSENRSFLRDAMAAGGVLHRVGGHDATSVLQCAVASLCLPGLNKEELLARLLERESLSSTGLGRGVAIPHPRRPVLSLTESAVVTAFLESPVPYNAIDGQPVSVLFILLAREPKEHLTMLSRLSFLLHQPSFLELLHNSPEQEQLLETVARAEQEMA